MADATFNKVKSGISGLKKEREELRRSYKFLTEELSRMVEANAGGIKALAGKSAETAADVAAIDEKLKKSASDIAGVSAALSSGLSALREQSAGQAKALAALGERVQKSIDVAGNAVKDLNAAMKQEGAMSKSLESLGSDLGLVQQRTGSLDSAIAENKSALSLIDSSLRGMGLQMQALKKDAAAGDERMSRLSRGSEKNAKKLEMLGTLQAKISHIEDVKKSLIKGVESLRDIRNSMAALEERTRGLEEKLTTADKFLESKLKEKTGALDAQLSERMASMDSQIQDKLGFIESSLTERGNALEASLLERDKRLEDLVSADLKQIKADVAGELADMKKIRAEVKGLGKDTARLQAAAAALEKGREAMAADISSVSRRVVSLESLRSKVREIDGAKDVVLKGLSDLDGIRQDMASVKEKQAASDHKFSGEITALDAGMEKSAAAVTRISLGITAMRKDADAAAKAIAGIRTDQAAVKKRLDSVEDFGHRITQVEQLGRSLGAQLSKAKEMEKSIAGVGNDLALLRKDMAAGDSALAASLDASIASLKKELTSDSQSIGSLGARLEKNMLDVQAMKKDLKGTAGSISDLKQDLSGAKVRMGALERLPARLSEMEKADDSLSARIGKIEPVAADLAAARRDMTALKAGMDNADSVLDGKIDYNVSSLKKESAFSSTRLARLEEDMKKMSLSIHALGKDLKSAGLKSKDMDVLLQAKVDSAISGIMHDSESSKRSISKVSEGLSALQKKTAELEKLQVKLGDTEAAERALKDAMEAKLDDRMKFIEASLHQKGDNIVAEIGEKSRAMEDRLRAETAALGKDLAAKSRSLAGMKAKVDSLGKVQERMGRMEKDRQEIVRSLASLQDMKPDMSVFDEKAGSLEKEVRALKAELSRSLTDFRGRMEDARSERREKFDTAVKAFLNTKADIGNRMSTLDLKLSELGKRLTDFSKMTSRIDLLERKVDRLTERSSEIRKDIDDLGRKAESDEKIMFVDLDSQKARRSSGL